MNTLDKEKKIPFKIANFAVFLKLCAFLFDFFGANAADTGEDDQININKY